MWLLYYIEDKLSLDQSGGGKVLPVTHYSLELLIWTTKAKKEEETHQYMNEKNGIILFWLYQLDCIKRWSKTPETLLLCQHHATIEQAKYYPKNRMKCNQSLILWTSAAD